MADRLTRRGLLGALAALPFVGRAFRREEPESMVKLEPDHERLFTDLQRLYDRLEFDPPMDILMVDEPFIVAPDVQQRRLLREKWPQISFVEWTPDGAVLRWNADA